MQVALDNGLTPLFCIGELLEERESGKTEVVVTRQINAVIAKVGIKAFKNIIIAYEPVWAIGTGVTATPQQAQDTHAFIRSLLAENDADIAQSTPILYGGSMNPANAEELIACEDIDGGLIGGASLKPEDFLSICKAG
ncbi:Triosephosphate isomerase [hydrothermal vent metagenome]|uniref:Triosephosphate isomerase n=1 Tax=hydrothermal vent metagenome TaxID=652676 RepID=A0A1W1E4Q7_9ZZZZ